MNLGPKSHAPVTVTDTSTVDLTISQAQVLSADLVAGSYVPPTRQITIDGTTNQVLVNNQVAGDTFDLSADRTWTISLPQNVDLNTDFQVNTIKFNNIASTTYDASLSFGMVDGDDSLLKTVSLSDINGNLDHGTLTGLSDDDHSQYFLLAGRNGNVANLIQNGITTTSTQTLALQNTTAATSGVQAQYSPALDFLAKGWRSIPGDSRDVRFRQELQVTGGAPTGTLVWKSSVDSASPSFTNRMTLTTAGGLTVQTVTASGLTSGRVPVVSTSGLIIDDPGLLYNNSTDLLTLATTGSGAGLAFGASGTPPQIYESTATSGSGDTLINSGVTFRRGNWTFSAPTHTSTSANEYAVSVGKTFTPGAAASGRMWGLSFNAIASGSFNFTDNTSAIVGIEGTVTNNSTATMTAMSAAILFNTMGANATTSRFAGIDIYGADVSGSGGVGATATEAAGAIIRMGRSSGNTSLGNITNLWGVQLRASTWSGTGHMTAQVGVGYASGTTMNAITANSQTRVMFDIPDMPSPGAFTGTVIQGIRFNNSTRAIRNGIAWGTTAYLWESGAGTLTVAGAVDGTTTANITLAGSGVLTAPGSTVTPLVNPATGVALVVRGVDSTSATTGVTLRGGDYGAMGGDGGTVTIRGGNAGSAAGVAGSVTLQPGTKPGGGTAGKVTHYKSDGSTVLFQTDDTGIGFFGVTPVARASAYTPTNVTTDRSYDANSTTVDELADVLGTLIADLQAYGVLQ